MNTALFKKFAHSVLGLFLILNGMVQVSATGDMPEQEADSEAEEEFVEEETVDSSVEETPVAQADIPEDYFTSYEDEKESDDQYEIFFNANGGYFNEDPTLIHYTVYVNPGEAISDVPNPYNTSGIHGLNSMEGVWFREVNGSFDVIDYDIADHVPEENEIYFVEWVDTDHGDDEGAVQDPKTIALQHLLMETEEESADLEFAALPQTLSINDLRSKFPHGKYWNHADNPGKENSKNNQDGYTNTPCTKGVHGDTIGTAQQQCNAFCPGSTQLSWQCMGYAEKCGYDTTGFNPRSNSNGWNTTYSSSALDTLKAGDIVRYRNNNHSIFITSVSGDTVYFTDCNWNGVCNIRWDVSITKSTLLSSFNYVRVSPGAASTPDPDEDTRYSAPFTIRYMGSSKCYGYRSIDGSQSGWIDPGDDCTVKKVFVNGWVLADYPGTSSTATRYFKTNEFFWGETNPRSVVAYMRTDCYYDSARTQKNGWIDPGDPLVLLREENGSTLCVYPGSSGNACRWAKTDEVVKPIIDIGLASMNLSNWEMTYTGGELRPSVSVVYNGVTVDPANYDVYYSNNVNAGTATCTVTGKGNYTGTKTANFTISPAAIASMTIPQSSYEYTGSAITPEPTVKNTAGTVLQKNTHYTVAYTNNTNVGTATVTVTGKGNYTGTKSANFTIVKKEGYLDLNGYLDGQEAENIAGYGTVDIYVNGRKEAEDVTDYYQPWTDGSDYYVTNIKPVKGKEFVGYQQGEPQGKIAGNEIKRLKLEFRTIDTSDVAKPINTEYYNGHTYMLFDDAVTWHKAQQVCEEYGGHLVTIGNEEENSFIVSNLDNRRIWLGATDIDEEGVWKWITGEVFIFSDWSDGQPDNAQGNIEQCENYAEIYTNGKWNDMPGSILNAFLCEIDSIPVQSISLDKTSLRLAKNEFDKLTATILPANATNKNVIWSSSNTAVAKVLPDGTVLAQSKGTAVITVTTEDGGYTDTCTVTVADTVPVTENASVKYSALVQDEGWQSYVKDGETAGTFGQSKKLEAIKIEVEGTNYTGNIEYQTHVQKYGWESTWKKNGEISGSLESLRLESMRIRLTGELAEHYDIYYRLHVQKFGWLDWAKNGQSAGSSGFGYRVEGIQIKLVEKGKPAPGATITIFHDATAEKFTQINYQTQVQRLGWLETVSNGEMSGTQQQGLRVEGIKMWLSPKGYSGSVEYRTSIQRNGWEQTWAKDGSLSGTSGQSLRLEAIQIRLTEELADHYDIYYRVQAQRYGWMNWMKNGETAGTENQGLRLEAIQIKLVEKGSPAPTNSEDSE